MLTFTIQNVFHVVRAASNAYILRAAQHAVLQLILTLASTKESASNVMSLTAKLVFLKIHV